MTFRRRIRALLSFAAVATTLLVSPALAAPIPINRLTLTADRPT
jgi:hypothetical protein